MIRRVGFALALAATCAPAAGQTRGQTRGQTPGQTPGLTPKLVIEPASTGRLPWVVFDERSGLPQHTIVDLMVDRDGYVWAATQDGPARYDGRTWEPVPLPKSMGTNYPRAMKPARDGGIWIGSFDGGLAHYQDGAWRVIDVKSGLPSNRIRGLLETRDALWIATDKGLARLAGERVEAFGEKDGLPSLDTEGLCECGGTLLAGTANGLARWTGSRFEPMPVPDALRGSRIGDIVESPGLGGKSAIWITSYGAGLGVLEDGAWRVLDVGSGLPSNVEVLTPSRADDGSPALWIGSEGGLLRFEHGRFTIYDERNGLPVRTVWKVLETTSPSGLRTVWLGTYGGGILRLSPNHWTAYDASVGVPPGAVTSVLLTRDQTLYAGTANGELASSGPSGFQRIELPQPMRNTLLFSLLETRDAANEPALWVASFGGGIGRYARGRWTLIDAAALPNPRVYQLLETKNADGSAVLWAGTEGGLARYANGQWQAMSGLPSEIVTQVRAIDGTIWVGTSRGIARLDGDTWHVMGKDAGLASENIVSLDVVDDESGRRWLWAGTLAGGAARLPIDERGARWESFGTWTRPALPTDTVQSIAHDGSQRVYLCTTHGIARLTPRAATGDDPAPFAVDVFTTEDGLPSGDCEQGASASDARGRVWFGTARGLAMFDPLAEKPDREPKPLRIERAELADHSRALRGGEVLAHTGRNLRFSAALLAYGAESRIRYRFQLAGFDPVPTEWSAASSKEYTNLGPGLYAFRAWARDARGNESGPVELAFRIEPAPWLTPWAYAAYAALLALAVFGFLSWRTRVLAARARGLERIVAERTTALRDSERRAHEASQAKSVFLANMSHELRTPLNAVLGFTRLLRRSHALGAKDRDSLSIIEKSGEHLLSLINQVLSIAKIEAGSMTLERKPFDLHELLHTIERMFQARCEEAALEFTVELDPALPESVIGDAGKLRQALINLLGNATKFTKRGGVALRVRWAAGRATFEVADTGAGIAPDEIGQLFQPFVQTATGRGASEGTGLGLAITRRIVELMGGTIAVESTVGVGTTFRFDARLEPCEAAPRAPEPELATALAPGQVAPRILVVDDARENRQLLLRLLESVGIAAREAENGAQALEAWRHWQPDAIFTDVRMPVLDGRELMRRIRAEESSSPARKRVVLVALTASVFDAEAGELVTCGADRVLFKPYPEAAIFQALTELAGVRFRREAAPPDPRGLTPGLTPGARVLVVDDDFINRAVAGQILADLGHAVVEAESGEAALARLDADPAIALVLLDIEMPRMGGIETARRIRADARRADLPVIAMSGHTDDADVERFRAAGMNDHVAKPVEPAVLAARLAQWLRP